MSPLSPYDMHIGEWFYANVDDKQIPVKVGAIYDDQVTATNQAANIYDIFAYDKLSPIPVDKTTLNLFNWSGLKEMSIHQNKTTGVFFVRYIDKKKILKKWFKKHGSFFVHELQQFYYDKKQSPLSLDLALINSSIPQKQCV